MDEAITDTGPVLHLHQIGQFRVLDIFDRLLVPDLVAEELRSYTLDLATLVANKREIIITNLERSVWEIFLAGHPPIHPADAQVFALAQSYTYRFPVLTDDLALRQRLESAGATVVGSVGILVRAYTSGHLQRRDLDGATDALFEVSTLYMSRAFKAYVRQLLTQLP